MALWLKMAEDKLVEEEIIVEDVVKEDIAPIAPEKRHTAFDKESWKPKTSLGVKVKSGEINDIEYVLDNRLRILEHEIVDVLMPNLVIDLLFVGQSKGKFGGGQKRVFRQTQK